MPKYTNNEPLHLAAELGQVDQARQLLDAGTGPDVKDRHLRTPLMIAAKNNQKEVASLLIERGADVNAKDRRSDVWEGRCTALHFACESGLVGMAGLLLSNGADPDCPTQNWSVPLTDAVAVKNHALAECLLRHGANPNGPPTHNNRPPIVSAASADDLKMVKILLKMGADPDQYGGDGRIALCETTSLECARELIAGGADPNGKDRDGLTIFHHKLLLISPEMVSFLINAGTDVNELRMQDKASPLHFLAMNPRVDNARVLIEAGANVNALSEGRTPLDICLYLIEKSFNASVERQNLAELFRRHGGKTAKEL